MARKLRNVEVGREVSFNCGTLLSEQNGGGGGDLDTVVTVRLEEETRPDGTVLRRSVISQRPRVSKIWMKNSTNGSECWHGWLWVLLSGGREGGREGGKKDVGVSPELGEEGGGGGGGNG